MISQGPWLILLEFKTRNSWFSIYYTALELGFAHLFWRAVWKIICMGSTLLAESPLVFYFLRKATQQHFLLMRLLLTLLKLTLARNFCHMKRMLCLGPRTGVLLLYSQHNFIRTKELREHQQVRSPQFQLSPECIIFYIGNTRWELPWNRMTKGSKIKCFQFAPTLTLKLASNQQASPLFQWKWWGKLLTPRSPEPQRPWNCIHFP